MSGPDKLLSRTAIEKALRTGLFNAEASLARAEGRTPIDDRAEWEATRGREVGSLLPPRKPSRR